MSGLEKREAYDAKMKENLQKGKKLDFGEPEGIRSRGTKNIVT